MKKLFIGLPIQSTTALLFEDRWSSDPELNRNRMAWTKPSNWHVTLFFLGPRPDWQIGILGQLIDSSFHEIHSFTSPLKGLGVFPEEGKPRVLWLGLDNIQPLMAAYAALGNLLQENGFHVDPKPLKPHLTLARIKTLADRPSLESLLRKYDAFDFGTVPIHCVTLFESISTVNGVMYVPLYEKWLLRGPAEPRFSPQTSFKSERPSPG